MRKLGAKGLKWMQIIHVVLVALFFGGIMSSTALNLGMKMESFDIVFESYKRIIVISDYIIRTGAVGTLIIGLLYGFITNWGFFKHRWVTVKWVLFIAQTLIGIFVVDKLMLANMAILESRQESALIDSVFIHNETIRQYAVFVQIGITLVTFCISVLKPWKKKKKAHKINVQANE